MLKILLHCLSSRTLNFVCTQDNLSFLYCAQSRVCQGDLYCTDIVQCIMWQCKSDNITCVQCHQRPISDQRWHPVTNKAFMSAPRPVLAASGLVIYFLSTDLLSDMILEMMRYFILQLLIFFWIYKSFFFPSKMGAFFSTFRFYYLNPRNLLFAFIILRLWDFTFPKDYSCLKKILNSEWNCFQLRVRFDQVSLERYKSYPMLLIPGS